MLDRSALGFLGGPYPLKWLSHARSLWQTQLAEAERDKEALEVLPKP